MMIFSEAIVEEYNE